MMKKLLSTAFLISAMYVTGFSQTEYKSAIGARLAPESYYDFFAFSYKTFVTNAGALEFNAGGGSRRQGYYLNNDFNRVNPFSLSVSATYQHHFKIPVQGLQWFVGGGLVAYNSFSDEGDYRGFGFGLYPTGGVDWKIPKVPINLTADYRPTFLVTRPDKQGDSFEARNFGIAVRYTIGER
ncbi:MAG: hypothetical protein ACTHLE_15030 [Agriterribacter sp.]